MNLDLILFKVFLDRTQYNKYSKILDLDFYRNNNKEMFKVFLCLNKYYEEFNDNCSIDQFTLYYFTLYPLAKDEEKHYIESLLSQVVDLEIDDDLVESYLSKHLEQRVATSVALKALEVSQGKGSLDDLKALLEYPTNAQEGGLNEFFVSDDLEILVNSVIASEGLRWRLGTLNKSIGSLRKGDFGFIFARPETGKTTFLASEVTYMAQQAKEKGMGGVLWLNNEEQGSKVMLRCYQAVFGVEQQALFTNLDYYKDEYEKIIGSHIRIYDNAKITKKDVEKICDEMQPSLIICDQIDKVAWVDSERYDLKMKAIYQWARELSKQYGAFIGVCQAGGTAEGKKYLKMNDVDSSHTAKQGEADFMLGIGKTNTDGEEYLRFLSICKNKLAGDSDTNPELRHAKLPVVIQPTIARYQDSIQL
jgi:replicative DNA helicase